MRSFAAEHFETEQHSIASLFGLLLSQGLGKTLEQLCTISVFSILSPA